MSASIINHDALLQILRDPERKSVAKMAQEVFALWRSKNERPGHYFKSFLYRRYVDNPAGFLTQAECAALWQYFLKSESDRLLTDKVLFHQHFSEVEGVRLPHYLGHTDGDRFVDAAGAERPLRAEGDLERVLGQLLGLVRAAGGTSVFVKPVDDQGGRGAFKLTEPVPPGKLCRVLQNRDYIFQQTVEQHPAVAALLPDALNALRLTTLRHEGGEPRLASAWLKLGRMGNVTDSARGMLITSIELESGRLAATSRTKFNVGGETLTHHPDTGQLVSGFEIPAWNEAVEMVLAAARHTDYPVVGWDVGIATEGPVIIEGNVNSGYHIDEIAHGAGYLDHPDFGPFFRELLNELSIAS